MICQMGRLVACLENKWFYAPNFISGIPVTDYVKSQLSLNHQSSGSDVHVLDEMSYFLIIILMEVEKDGIKCPIIYFQIVPINTKVTPNKILDL